jgi:hypothetical protein
MQQQLPPAHHHHHHPGEMHPAAAVSPSLLRSSLGQRLAIAAGLSAAIWLVAYWALG